MMERVQTEEETPFLDPINDRDVEMGYQSTSHDAERHSLGREFQEIESIQETRKNMFEDGIRKIDFILVYEIKHNKQRVLHRELSNEEEIRQKMKRDKEARRVKWRSKFMRNLQRKGLQLEMDTREGRKSTFFYVKIHCPWEVLLYHAEQMNLRAPLQVREHTTKQGSAFILQKLHLPNILEIDVPQTPKHYYTCTIKISKLNKYLGSKDINTFFSTTDRIMITYKILQSTLYGKKRQGNQGIDRLILEKAFTAAFPLHDQAYRVLPSVTEVDPESLGGRQILYEYWARWSRWHKYQPLYHIRNYFGEKIAMYFAWLGFYTTWLHPVAFIGLMVFLFGIVGINSNIPAQDICKSGSNYKMCPLCPHSLCQPWYLNKTCTTAKIAYIFDHTGTIIFAAIMSFWVCGEIFLASYLILSQFCLTVLFLEFWKRKSAKLAYNWEVINLKDEERPRPNFKARAPTVEVNPITGEMEPHFPKKRKFKRVLTGLAVLLVMLGVVLIFVISVIIYKGTVGIIMMSSRSKFFHGEAGLIRSFSGAVINLILIMLMSNVYTAVAEWLTEWEMHRTQTDYDNALTFKVFIFQFVNYYSSIFYIAFFKGNLTGYPGHYHSTLGIRNEGCGSGGCLIELAQQLFVIMVGKQAINNIKEVVVPKLKAWWHRRAKQQKRGAGASEAELNPWEQDYHNLVQFGGLFEEYLEIVLQFGFITIFVAAFPLAPLFALLNNWLEIRLDAHNLVCETRRTVPERAQNIGIWYEILYVIAQISVITNAFLIAFTSDFIPKKLYQYTIGNGSLHGYVNFSLAYAPNKTGLGNCRYQAYRDREGHHTLFYYELMCARLTFVICFEHVVFFVGRMIDWSVPDVSESLQIKVKREDYLAKQALLDQ